MLRARLPSRSLHGPAGALNWVGMAPVLRTTSIVRPLLATVIVVGAIVSIVRASAADAPVQTPANPPAAAAGSSSATTSTPAPQPSAGVGAGAPEPTPAPPAAEAPPSTPAPPPAPAPEPLPAPSFAPAPPTAEVPMAPQPLPAPESSSEAEYGVNPRTGVAYPDEDAADLTRSYWDDQDLINESLIDDRAPVATSYFRQAGSDQRASGPLIEPDRTAAAVIARARRASRGNLRAWLLSEPPCSPTSTPC